MIFLFNSHSEVVVYFREYGLISDTFISKFSLHRSKSIFVNLHGVNINALDVAKYIYPLSREQYLNLNS